MNHGINHGINTLNWCSSPGSVTRRMSVSRNSTELNVALPQGDKSPRSPRRSSIARRTGGVADHILVGFSKGLLKGGKEIPHFGERQQLEDRNH